MESMDTIIGKKVAFSYKEGSSRQEYYGRGERKGFIVKRNDSLCIEAWMGDKYRYYHLDEVNFRLVE